MKRLIAICGLDCEKCDAYIATKNTCPKVGTIWQNNPQAKENLEA